ncbi:unnamed protein product [Didymodactylos carnosus]|uniref:CHHC U11-48K-type domain-containing protein n=1 Tax=Didymodactylos carnosus TaxID=1234261 RepID=A0A815VYX2_9BILA|nr:unnamed protein product [Didymodactylos carnosus]CAF1536722.1 unnamed protein product [Didymodactylos carnosus]CAF3845267.1 unnamed protein product [Didymodactylos carnosus]CAF4396684.1 unnamed protein product [Didymodactylos carnosus]
MSLFCDPDDFWLCPFDTNHKVLAKRFQYHLMRCAKANPHIRRVKCSFNATHLTTPEELIKHMSQCPDNGAVHNASAAGLREFNWNNDNSTRQMAYIADGEDWDKDVHRIEPFTEEEIQQMNRDNEWLQKSVTP